MKSPIVVMGGVRLRESEPLGAKLAQRLRVPFADA